MKPFKIIVLISGNGSNLQAIIDAINTNQWPIHIVAVISNKADAYGLERAHEHRIATHVLSSKNYDSKESYDKALIDLIDNYAPDLIVLAGFLHILSASFVNHYPLRIINLHPSLLPKYPGLETHAEVLKNKDKEHGCTVHIVNEILDGGPIIEQSTLEVKPSDTVESLQKRIQKLEHILLPKVIHDLAMEKSK